MTDRQNDRRAFADFAKRLLSVPKRELKDLDSETKKPKGRRKPKP